MPFAYARCVRWRTRATKLPNRKSKHSREWPITQVSFCPQEQTNFNRPFKFSIPGNQLRRTREHSLTQLARLMACFLTQFEVRMKRSLVFGLGCTIVCIGGAFSSYLATLENRPQIVPTAFVLGGITLFFGFTIIGRAIWPNQVDHSKRIGD